jgi:hypothetical protein
MVPKKLDRFSDRNRVCYVVTTLAFVLCFIAMRLDRRLCMCLHQLDQCILLRKQRSLLAPAIAGGHFAFLIGSFPVDLLWHCHLLELMPAEGQRYLETVKTVLLYQQTLLLQFFGNLSLIVFQMKGL